MRRSSFAPILTAAALTLVLVGCEQKSFSQKFDQVNTGMTQAEVERVLGKGKKQEISGVSISGSGIASSSSSSGPLTYTWTDGSKEIAVVFHDGKAISKVKSGF